MKKINLRQVKGLFLDLDGTFYDYDPCNVAGKREAFTFLSDRLDRSIDEVEKAFISGRVKTKVPLKTVDRELAASHSRLLYFQKAIEELTGQTHYSYILDANRIFWSKFIETMEIFPAAETFLKKAKAARKKTVIITDMTAKVQMQKILKLGIGPHIDFLVSSEEAGYEKPHAAPLELALAKTGLKPKEVVMIGEDEARDIKAAICANVTPIAIRYKPANPDVNFVKDFAALTELLEL